MFNFLKRHGPSKDKINRTDLQTVTLKLSGLHCTSCAVNIDLSLEELPSVVSKTNYAKSETIVTFNPDETSQHTIQKAIVDLGYTIVK